MREKTVKNVDEAPWACGAYSIEGGYVAFEDARVANNWEQDVNGISRLDVLMLPDLVRRHLPDVMVGDHEATDDADAIAAQLPHTLWEMESQGDELAEGIVLGDAEAINDAIRLAMHDVVRQTDHPPTE